MDIQWCIACGLRVVEPSGFFMRECKDPNLYCARCRVAIDLALEEVFV